MFLLSLCCHSARGSSHLDRDWIVAAIPLQYSILSDGNFYARYNCGKRTNRGITYWNAGNAYLANKTNDTENIILDHHCICWESVKPT
jgi:hypothetical protein